jgi:two-component system chemotaxis sensor kinase CheA
VIGQIGKEMLQNHGLTAEGAALQKAYQALDRRVGELQEGLVEIRMIPIGQVFDRLVRVVRKLSRELGKEVDLQISGEETKLDKSMIEDIADPLMHLIRNSLDHGIESKEERRKAGKSEIGIINLRAMQKGNSVLIEVEDDGMGIDLARVYKKGIERGLLDPNKDYEQRELVNVLFMPGFSTAEAVTEVSGRGVGLDVVAKNITKLSGMVDVNTEMGKGTTFSITLPITLVIIKALVVRVGDEIYAIPLSSVSESLMIKPGDIRTVERREVVQLRDQTLALLRLKKVFQLPENPVPDSQVYVIVVGLAEKRLGLVVDAIEGQQEIVIKSLGEMLRDTPGIAGATGLGNRRTILVLDVAALIEEATQVQTGGKAADPELKKKTGKPVAG